jgi:hypothetical protein
MTRLMNKIQKSRNLYSSINWQPSRKIGLTLGSLLRRVVWLRDGGPTKNWIQTALYFGRYVDALQRSQGWRGVVIHLKVCHVLLMQAVARNPCKDPRQLGCAISRSRSGLPLVIPVRHRMAILSMDKWTIKIWSSFFWLYRVIEIPGKVKLSSITKPFEVNYLIIVAWATWIVQFLPVFLEFIGEKETSVAARKKGRSDFLKWKYISSMLVQCSGIMPIFAEYLSAFLLPTYKTRLHCRAMKEVMVDRELKVSKDPKDYFPGVIKDLKPQHLTLLTSGPNSAKPEDEGPGPGTRTATGAILTDLFLLRQHPETAKWVQELMPGQLEFARSLMVSAKRVFAELEREGYEPWIDQGLGCYLHSQKGEWEPTVSLGFSQARSLGKLAFIPEPAGKIRVVAMVDYVTQAVLKPLHTAVFEILRKIPQDGTFDQHAPIRRLAESGCKPYFCYDLSAATDRFPATMLQVLLSFLLNASVAKAWRALLNSRDFKVPRRVSEKQRVPRNTPRSVKYRCGQPMGAYGHWAVFSLGHHMLVQFAAYQAYNKLSWFGMYALLGDDIVIADAMVAERYLALLRAIGVEVGFAKSICSKNGILEFAKKLFLVTGEGSLIDLSGISLKEIGACYANPDTVGEILSHTNVRGPREAILRAMRLLGYGPKLRSSLMTPINKLRPRVGGLIVLLTRPGSVFGFESFTQWVTRVSLGSQGVLRKEEVPRVLDAIQQRLLAKLEIAISRRTEWLWEHKNPIKIIHKEDSLVPEVVFDSDILWPPEWFGKLNLPEYRMFIHEKVFAPFIAKVHKETCGLIADYYVWKNPNAEQGNMSLDDVYTSLTRLTESLAAIPTQVNLFIRDKSLDSRESKRRTAFRSSTVKLWRKVQGVVHDALDT